ncbi:MAG TPA: DUF2628 domain-containing protein [Polyangiales bacterium]|nr:DUF2628 domain-containing protein [Polyangiales bacterium]
MSSPNIRDPEQWVPRELFAAYCGEESGSMLAYYDKAKTKRKAIVFSFDWLAFFVLPAWLGYRRQWALWATLTVSIAVITAGAALLDVHVPGGAFGGGLIAMALMARGLLLTSANSLYSKLKQRGLAADAIRAELANKAAPSVGLAIAGLLGALVVQGLVAALARLAR